MRLMYTLFLICLGVGATACLTEQGPYGEQPGESTRNVNELSGAYVVAEPAPWHAGIYTKATNPYMQICGGTLVTQRAIISAAHCFTLDRNVPPASRYAVAAGKIFRPYNNPRDQHAQKSDVKEINIPPRYQGNVANFQDDIAVLIVVKEFNLSDPTVAPACVNFNPHFDAAHLQDGELGLVVGWGLTGANSKPSQVLQSALLPNVAIERCIEQSSVGFRSSITGDKVCAGHTNGTAVCRGDSGGGLIFNAFGDVRSLFYLRGVVSTSPATENMCNIYTWATFTHLLKHEHFVKSYVPDVEQFCVDYEYFVIPARQVNRSTNDKHTCKCPKSYDVMFYNKKMVQFIYRLNV